MPSATQPLSMQEGLTEMMGTLSKMLMNPEADQEFLNDLQQIFIAKIHQPMMQQGQQGQQGQGANGQQPGMPQQPGQGGGPPVTGPGGPPSSSMPQPGQNQLSGPQPPPGQGVMPTPVSEMTNPDELRRYLSTRTGS